MSQIEISEEMRKKKLRAKNKKQLTGQQKDEIKKAFDFFDITGSGILLEKRALLIGLIGTIEAKNLKVVLRALGFDPSNEEIVKSIREVGRNITKLDDEMIDFQEFLEIMNVKMVKLSPNSYRGYPIFSL